MHDDIRINIESPNRPEILTLIDALDAYQKPLYPADSHHGMDIDALCATNVVFAVARSGDGEAIACGPFGAYTDDPNSVFMVKNATGATAHHG